MREISKRIFGVILAIVMLVPMFPSSIYKVSANSAAAQRTYATGDIINFGSYPQTRVDDAGLIAALNSTTPDAENNATYGGSKYKRVFFTQYTPFYTSGTPDASNSNQDDNGYYINTVYWFKFEPMQWQVLSNTNGELFVMAKKILDSNAYNQVFTGVTWETCTLRTWLNNDFFNTAFNSTEQSKIKTSAVVNADSPLSGTSGGNNTNDKLFLLSYADTISYGFSPIYSSYDGSRRAQGTDFSKSNGLYVSTESSYSGNSSWWLRSPGNDTRNAGIVFFDGYVTGYGDGGVAGTVVGTRPVFKINLADITFNITFDANGGLGGTSGKMAFGETLTAPLVTRPGYSFAGWSPEVPATVPNTNTTYTAQWIKRTFTTGDILEFGTYPQTKVTDENLIAALNAQTLESEDTVTYDGSRYKRVYFTVYTPYYTTFPPTASYSHQDDNGYYIDTVYWFKFEPLRWRVLSAANDELFVIAEKIVEARFYHNGPIAVTWENCFLRSWLNNNFYYGAFSSAEQAQIKTSMVANTDHPVYGSPGGKNSVDRLFLLSYDEAVNPGYGFSTGTGSDAAREAKGTDYSKSQGLTTYTGAPFDGNCYWRLRTPGYYQSDSAMLDFDGNLYSYYAVNGTCIGIRPVLKMNLPTITSNITFDANGGMGGMTGPMTAGEPLMVPSVYRDGYTFTGWSPEVPATVPDADTTYTAQWISNTVTTGDIIEFGSYPQSKVKDAALITTLNLQTLQADSTVTYNGSKYKKVYFTQYTPYWSTGSTNASDTFQDNNGYFINTVYWFKYEPMQWRVLSNTNGELFVMAEKVLDAKAYNQTETNVTWETCTMRSWLNNDFYNTAFNLTQQKRIKTSTVVNANNPWTGMLGSSTTNDKLFLLSYAEAMNTAYGFESSYEINDIARRAQGTDFSKSNGLYAFVGSSYSGNSIWWLRSPGLEPNYAGIIYYDGRVDYGYNNVDWANVGARPATKINLSSVIITPKPGTDCVVDYYNGFIFGLNTGITSLADFVDIAAGYELSTIPNPNGFGTGTVVNVKLDGEIIESYFIVIFGDLNGDSNVDSMDAGKIVDHENNAITWHPTTDAALFKAGDLNGDGNIDSMDAGIAVDFENHKVNINQRTGLVVLV